MAAGRFAIQYSFQLKKLIQRGRRAQVFFHEPVNAAIRGSVKG
jgi:hypothetical protein